MIGLKRKCIFQLSFNKLLSVTLLIKLFNWSKNVRFVHCALIQDCVLIVSNCIAPQAKMVGYLVIDIFTCFFFFPFFLSLLLICFMTKY